MEKMVNQNKIRQVEDLEKKVKRRKLLINFNGIKADLMNRLPRREIREEIFSGQIVFFIEL